MAGIVDVEIRKQNFLKEIAKRQPNIQIVGEYINSYTPIKCYCPKHDYYWDSTPHNLMDGKTCKLCGVEKCSKSRTKSHEQFVQELAVANPNIEVLGTYVKSKDKIEVRCKIHDYVYKAVPNNLLTGIGCKYCGLENTVSSHTLSHNELTSRVLSKHPNITIITPDVANADRIECYCNIHNYKWTTSRKSFAKGHGCPKCSNEMRAYKERKSQDTFVSEVEKVNPNIDVIGNYIGRHSHIVVKCKKCGTEWNPMAASLLKGCECPSCRENTNYGRTITGVNDIATTHQHLLQYFKNIEDAYTHSFGSNYRATFKCPICGEEKTTAINSITTNGFVCPFCDASLSRPNKILHIILKNVPVDYYEFEYSPDWARRYKYDGYFEYNNQKYVVEMDGGYHYRTGIGGYYEKNDLTETQKRDKEKDRLAEEHNLIMIRIDCKTANNKYIINNVKTSLLGELFDINSINIDVEFTIDESKLKLICDTYNALDKKTAEETAKILKMCKHRVSLYLKRGNESGLCNYDANANKKLNCKPIKLTNAKTGEIFYCDSQKEALNKIRETGTKADVNAFKRHLNKSTEYKGFICETVSKQERSG